MIYLTPQSPLHRAAQIGDLAALDRLISLGININARTPSLPNSSPFFCSLTALMVAASSTDGATVDTLRWLVQQGADLYARSEGGTTAAWYAASSGSCLKAYKIAVQPEDRAQRLEYLLDKGLDPNECSLNGRSLLTEACRVGDSASVSLLLRRGVTALLTSQNVELLPYYQIPLFCASLSGSSECVRLILKSGADPNVRDDLNCTALMYAESPEAAQILIDAGVDIFATDTDGRNFLIDSYGEDTLQVILMNQSSGAERFKIAHMLLDAGANIEGVDRYGYTRLYNTAFLLVADAVDFLLKHGANPYAQQSNKRTPLHAACWNGYSEDTSEALVYIIDLLVNVGIDINTPDIEGKTPMHEAVLGDGANVTAIQALLSHGANPDLASEDGTTPLMLAEAQNSVESIRVLLAAGASKR